MAQIAAVGESRFGHPTAQSGERHVTAPGTSMMLKLSASSWAVERLKLPQVELILVVDRVTSGWMMSTAKGQKMPSQNAEQTPRGKITAVMNKTRELYVEVICIVICRM